MSHTCNLTRHKYIRENMFLNRKYSRDGEIWMWYKGIKYFCKTVRGRLKLQESKRSAERLRDVLLNQRFSRMWYLVALRLVDLKLNCSLLHAKIKENFSHRPHSVCLIHNTKLHQKISLSQDQPEAFLEEAILQVKRKEHNNLPTLKFIGRKNYYKRTQTISIREAILKFTSRLKLISQTVKVQPSTINNLVIHAVQARDLSIKIANRANLHTYNKLNHLGPLIKRSKNQRK